MEGNKTLTLVDGQVLGNLTKSAAGDWVTYNDAKDQIRTLGKSLGLKLGTFAPRSVSRSTLKVPVKDGLSGAEVGYLSAERKIGAPITFVTNTSADEIPPDVLADVMADEAKGQLKLKTQLGMS